MGQRGMIISGPQQSFPSTATFVPMYVQSSVQPSFEALSPPPIVLPASAPPVVEFDSARSEPNSLRYAAAQTPTTSTRSSPSPEPSTRDSGCCMAGFCTRNAAYELALMKNIPWSAPPPLGRLPTEASGSGSGATYGEASRNAQLNAQSNLTSARNSAAAGFECANFVRAMFGIAAMYRLSSIWGLLKHPGFWLFALIINLLIIGYNVWMETMVNLQHPQSTPAAPGDAASTDFAYLLVLLPVVATSPAWLAVVLWSLCACWRPGMWLGCLMCANTFFLIIFVPILATQYDEQYLWYAVGGAVAFVVCCVPCYRMYHSAAIHNQSDFAKIANNHQRQNYV